MVNVYQKAYGAVKEATNTFANPEEALAFYLEGASKYMAKAAVAAREDRFEDRFNQSNKALLIFYGILSHLEPLPAPEKRQMAGLIDYCKIMNEVIYRMNSKNDAEVAENLATEIKRMSDHWKQKAIELKGRQSQGFVPVSASAATQQPSVTMGGGATGVAGLYGSVGASTSRYSA